MATVKHDEFDGVPELYVLDALPQHERAGFERHLDSCEQCRADVDAFRSTVEAMGGPGTTMPPGLRAAVLAAVDEEAPSVGQCHQRRVALADVEEVDAQRREEPRPRHPRPERDRQQQHAAGDHELLARAEPEQAQPVVDRRDHERAEDERELIGEGTHERVVVHVDRFDARVQAKAKG